jgi:hypothetical protein
MLRAQAAKPGAVTFAESEPGDLEEADLVATMEVSLTQFSHSTHLKKSHCK